ncbi:hypothetical protein BV898_04062 [Hypsibius exemplaris]|uniref:Receptor ligand binding region domain-containing protein n=1 Tax=Hypsibius exemplaris TaxID=2072580 RepID=A0A1W0X349_HYPEX|nr:hypothetical protein BV898_04062 [Hypsibius exemplaris]
MPSSKMCIAQNVFTGVGGAGSFLGARSAILWAVLVLTGVSSSSRLSVEIVTLGYLYPNAGASLAYQGPALDYASEEMQRIYGGVLDVKHTNLVDVKILNCPTLMDNADVMLSKWYYGRRDLANVTALISTTCGEAVNINRLAANWNLLFISTAGVDPVIRIPSQSPTWVTTAHNSVSSYTKLYRNLLRYYGWATVFLVVDESSVPVYTSLADSLLHSVAGTSQTRLKPTVRKIKSKSDVDFINLLKDFRSVSRVLLFFGNAVILRKLLINAALSDLINGEFVYIGVEPFKFSLFGNLTWQSGDEYDEVARVAFRSLLILQPLNDTSLTADVIRNLAPTFLDRSRRDYNFSYNLNEMNGPGMTSSFAGVALLGQVLNETLGTSALPAAFHYADGQALKQAFINRTFSTAVGDLYIDQHGERAINLSVAYFDGNLSRTTYLVQLANSAEMTQIEEKIWSSGKGPPANEPACGFSGTKCVLAGSRNIAFGLCGAALAGLLLLAILYFALKRDIHSNPHCYLLSDTELVCAGDPTSMTTLEFNMDFFMRALDSPDLTIGS